MAMTSLNERVFNLEACLPVVTKLWVVSSYVRRAVGDEDVNAELGGLC